MAESKPVLLVVEDDEGLQRQLRWAYDDYEVVIAGDRESAIAMVRQHEPAVVTLDLGLPPDVDGTTEGFATLEDIQTLKPGTKVIIASGHGARESALRAIAGGAYDFYQKPVDIDTLGLIVGRAFHLHAIEAENARLARAGGEDRTVLGGMITAAPEMLKVARTIERVATADVSVMLLGASGTGKELLARGVHEESPRKDKPFVAINCAAIPENLLEAELFGYEKGAFTGAVKTTEGKIELAEGGTLFLDEVGDIPLPLQVKLLRFLQERVVERLGGRKTIAVDVRIVCATHQDLDAMIAQQTFRDDLYYRLNVIPLHLPPLRERRGDIPLLVKHFIDKFNLKLDRSIEKISQDALNRVANYRWPGNIRELENVIERSILFAEGPVIRQADLPEELMDHSHAAPSVAGMDEDRSMKDIVKHATAELERDLIVKALAETKGNVTQAARLLKISRKSLQNKMKEFGLRESD